MLKNPSSNTSIDAAAVDARTSFPPPQFPLRLHDMLDNAEVEGYQHIVCWLPEGNGFHIHDPDAMLPILQKCGFNQSKWKSFLRQLQNYGFRREIRGPTKGICKHPDLIRGRRELCMNMRRIKKWNSADNLKTHQCAKKSNTVNRALDLIEGRNTRIAHSAPTLSLRRHHNGSFTPPSIKSLYPPCHSTKNATFDFVPANSLATASKSQGARNLFMNRTQHLIWDIQKEISMVNFQQPCDDDHDDDDSSSEESDFDPFNYRCPSPFSKEVESMAAYETDNLMSAIFLHEPSLEETYD
jgi:hypothetical protein